MRSTLGLALAVTVSLTAQAAPEKMQAAEVGVGGTLSVQWRPVPQPGAGEVLIKVRAAGVNPVDWKAAQRRLGMVPGTDVSGTIDSVGEGVTDWKVGEQVLGFARQSGSYAEYAVIPVNSLARKPKSMTFEQAAGVPIAAETAYRALHETGKIARGKPCSSMAPRVEWVPPPCRSPRRLAPASSAPPRLTITISCARSVSTRSSTTRARNSKTS
jgi:hypothetical protein